MAGFRASLGYTYLSKYLTIVCQFVSSIALARLLTPADIGIYTVAAVFVGLGYLLREFGINQYIVQERELTPDRIRAAFTLNVIFGWGIALILFLAREPIGAFYATNEIRDVIGLLCINFIMVPMGAITFAHIRREMRFHHAMVIQVASAVVSTVVGISTAYYGAAYLSMVWSSIAGTFITVVLTFVFRPPGFMLWPGIREIPHVLAFCKYAGPSALITHAGSTAPDWILGKVLDMTAVGLFSRAKGTISLINKAFVEGLWGVTLPHFSKQHREGGIDKDQYITLVAIITAVAWPFFATLAILADPVIRLLFGNQWVESAPVLRVLCVEAASLYTIVLVEQMLVATGYVRISFILNGVIQTLTIIAVLGGAAFGLIWVAVGIAAIGIVRLIIYQIASHRILALSMGGISKVFVRNIALTGWTIVVPLLFIEFLGEAWLTSWLPFSGMATLTGFIWLLGVRILQLSLWEEIVSVANSIGSWAGLGRNGPQI